jgi:hypothetical protein
MAVTAVTAFALAAIVVSLGREQRAVEFGVVPAE